MRITPDRKIYYITDNSEIDTKNLVNGVVYYNSNSDDLYVVYNGELIDLNTSMPITSYNSNSNYDDISKETARRFNGISLTKCSCHSCGAPLEIDSSKGIFKCPYCRSTYAIGTSKIRAY